MYPRGVASVLQVWPETATVVTIRICCHRQAQKKSGYSQSCHGGNIPAPDPGAVSSYPGVLGRRPPSPRVCVGSGTVTLGGDANSGLEEGAVAPFSVCCRSTTVAAWP